MAATGVGLRRRLGAASGGAGVRRDGGSGAGLLHGFPQMLPSRAGGRRRQAGRARLGAGSPGGSG
jgi:hypothetical protein